MPLKQVGTPSVEFATFYAERRSKLYRLAEQWTGGKTDDADEAVQSTFIFAWNHPERLPADSDAIDRWLIAILKFAVKKVRFPRHGRHYRRRTKTDRLLMHVTSEAGETTEHSIAVAVASNWVAEDVETDGLLEALSIDERNLLFDDVSSNSDDWGRRKKQAGLRKKLRDRAGGAKLPSSQSRTMDFIRFYAEVRRLKPEHYLSAYRVLERKLGHSLRLCDLNNDFFVQHVSSLSTSARKRIIAVWNAAASIGIIPAPPKHARQSVISHPAHWSEINLKRVVSVAAIMKGNVGSSRVPKNCYWPAIICLAADTGLPFVDLLQMNWPQLRSNERFKTRARAATVEYLKQLQKRKSKSVFPWTAAPTAFYKHYGRIVREAGMAESYLTPREMAVLRGTAEGVNEKDLAERFECGIGNIRDYRQRLREKLNIRGTWSIRKLVDTAKDRGFL